ncbi:hypothetical protein QT607_22660, partial [Xanthomonas citri pv. citri]
DMRAVTDAVMAVTGQLLQCSPQVTAASGAPGTWWVGASGFDNVGGEDALSEQLLRIVRVWHPEARIAIADSCHGPCRRVGAANFGDTSHVHGGSGWWMS